VRPHQAQESLQVIQVDLHDPVEELVGPARVAGQEHEEVVDPVEELAHLQEIAAEQSDDCPVRALAEPLGPLRQDLLPLGAGAKGSGRAGNRAPHGLVHGLGNPVQIVLIEERPMGLLEVDGAVGHLAHDPPTPIAEHPPPFHALGRRPSRHLARSAIGQRPIDPVLLLQGEAPAQLDRVHVEPLQDVFIHDGQLLDRVVDADRTRRQPQGLAELCVRDGRNARGTVAAEVDRHAIRFAVLQGRQHALSRGHRLLLP